MSAVALVGCCAVHRQLLEKLSRVANTDAEILISGPCGSPKFKTDVRSAVSRL